MSLLLKTSKRKRRILVAVAIGAALVIGVLARPALHLLNAWRRDVDELRDALPGYINDASRLNETKVAKVWSIPVAGDAEAQIAQLLAKARAEELHVSIAGARHSMGGHTIYPGGIVVNMLPWNRMELDDDGLFLNVQAGALWKQVIPYLDQRGRSVGVMQSDNDFSVGGSLSVNCHGWQYDRPPIASTVESFRLMQADGSVVRCSRTENAELFSLALGGYGLFGIILDARLRTVPNERYRLEQHVVRVDDALATFDARIENRPGVEMVYARMNIAPQTFLGEVIINAFIRDGEGEIPKLSEPGLASLRRAIFRGSAGSDYGKDLRWSAETRLQPFLSGKAFSRNQLLNSSSETFRNRLDESTDVLHEYFVPRERAAGFVAALRRIVPGSEADLLNITVRAVNEDADTYLRYADRPMLAFVMLFVHERTTDADQRMQKLTRTLIDAAIEHDGRYYLPYRLHATRAQFDRAYPRGGEFFGRKRAFDPGELFQNQFYLQYGQPAAESARTRRES